MRFPEGDSPQGQSIEADHSPCIFCEIRDGRGSGSTIVETDEAFAIMALEGHPLVMPKNHVTRDEVDKDPEILLPAYRLAHSLIPSVESAMEAQGTSIVVSMGEAAGQEIEHVHIHLFPRTRGDREITYRSLAPLPRAELDSRARRIAESFRP